MYVYQYNIFILVCLLVTYFIFKKIKNPHVNSLFKNKSIKNVLVMFSGGLDSTTALYKLLKDTDYNIYAHHTILKDSTERWKDELHACKNIVKYLQTIRNFNYSESTFHLPLNSVDKLGGYRDDDNTTILFIASKIFTVEAYKDIDYIVISNLDCEMDHDTLKFMNNFIDIMHKYKWTSKKPTLLNPTSIFNDNKCYVSKNLISKLLNLSNSTKLSENKNIYINDNDFTELICTKKKMFNYLSDELKNNFVYCRNPNNKKTCNKCFNCILYKNII